MYLYGDEWGKAANVDALGLVNAKVVRKLTIFADDVLVKQYLQDVMGPEFDAEEVKRDRIYLSLSSSLCSCAQLFVPRATVLGEDDDAPQVASAQTTLRARLRF